jgi:hypothetical protein
MSDTLNGPTDFAGMTATIVDGTITVNQRPVAHAGGPYAVDEGGTVTLDGSKSSDPDVSDTIVAYQWDLDGDAIYAETGNAAERGDEVGVAPTFVAAGLDGFGSWMVRLRVHDNNGLVSAPVSAAITVNDTNQAPTLVSPIADQTAGANRTFRLVLSPNTFADPDAGQTLSYAATQPDGSPLPRGLAFDSQTMTFSGRPLVRDVGQYDIRVTATDSGSPALAASAEFSITVTPYQFPWQNADLPPDVDGSETVTPLDVLIVINWINRNGSGSLADVWPERANGSLSFVDVNGDDSVSPIDVLSVINFINNDLAYGTSDGEGEGLSSAGDVYVMSDATSAIQAAEGEAVCAEDIPVDTSLSQSPMTGLPDVDRDQVFQQHADLQGSDDEDELLTFWPTMHNVTICLRHPCVTTHDFLKLVARDSGNTWRAF